jgi:hypothetical protein
MRAYVFAGGLVLMRALLCLAMIVGLSVILAIALMRMACFATEECFLFMHTRRRRRDRLIPIKLILVKGAVWVSPHHALESQSTQLRPTLRKQSFSGVAKTNRGMSAQTRPTHGQAHPAVEKRIRDQ